MKSLLKQVPSAEDAGSNLELDHLRVLPSSSVSYLSQLVCPPWQCASWQISSPSYYFTICSPSIDHIPGSFSTTFNMFVVAFTAGSLGDILATAGIIIQITGALMQSSSSCKQYRDVIDELKSLHRVLLLANDATSNHHPDLPLSQSLVDSVKTEVCDCHLMMRSFLDNIRRYRARRGSSVYGVRSGGRFGNRTN